MEFLNENTVIGEISNEQFKEEIKKMAKRRRKKRVDQRDGFIQVYSEQFEYKEIPYLIKIIRYYQIGVPIHKIQGINKIGKWIYLEHPKSIEHFVSLIKDFGYLTENDIYKNFLWNSTIYRDDLSLKQMVELMHKEARDSINGLEEMDLKFEEYMKERKEKFEKGTEEKIVKFEKLKKLLKK